MDTNIFDPDFFNESLILIYQQKLLGPLYPSQNLFNIKIALVSRWLFQEFTINSAFLIKDFPKGQALSTIGKKDFLPGEIPISKNLYIFINTIPPDINQNSNIIPAIKEMIIKAIESEIIILNNSGDDDNSDNENILNNKNFSGKDF